MADDERFRTPRARNEHRSELRGVVKDILRTGPGSEWIELLNAAGVPCGPIFTVDQTFADPQVQHLQLAQTVHSPTYGDIVFLTKKEAVKFLAATLVLKGPRLAAELEPLVHILGRSAGRLHYAVHRNPGA